MPEAREFVWAVCSMLGAKPDAEVRLLGSGLPPDGVPVFKLTYLKALRARAEEEGRLRDVTRH
ncbi:hypothetical protein SAMN05216345_13311 [Cupriavidus sp. YR651]|nr:hypothetical protein SAMN05216345_13311 [Cupriavidus sp. YR651]